MTVATVDVRTYGSTGHRRALLLVALVLLFTVNSAVIVGPDARATDAPPLTLSVGGEAFWDGPFVDAAGFASDTGSGDLTLYPGIGAPSANLCAATIVASSPLAPDDIPPPAPRCFEYALDVAGDGELLRVAVDHPSNYDSFGIVLVDPSGIVADEDTGEVIAGMPGNNTFSAEVYAHRPRAGTWRVAVVANDVRRSAFRVRAALQSALPPPGERAPLLPNLQAIPPFQVGFAPCHAAEESAYGAVRCLRLAQGPQNVGEGPLDLIVRDVGALGRDANGQETLVGTQYQRIHYSDGTTTEVPAGTFDYHVAHAHYHHSETGNLELYRVLNRHAGRLERAGAGPKQGFCMGDYAIAEWGNFSNEPRRDELGYLGRPNCGIPTPAASHMGLTAGWGDVYPRWVEGNFVEFGENPDGLYVVRAAVNPDRSIHESRYDDNVAYTYLKVCDGYVSVIERGIGTDPWDRSRVVVNDHRQPTMDTPKIEPPPPLDSDRPCATARP